jgi:ketosteroid isomerase-like protein
MLVYTTLVVVAALLGPADAKDDAKRAVEKAAKALQVAWDKGDAAAVKRLMTADHVCITRHFQSRTRADQLKALPDFKYTDRRISALQVTMVSKDTAFVTLKAATKGTYRGRPFTSTVLAGMTWIRRAGKWREASYQETPVAPD